MNKSTAIILAACLVTLLNGKVVDSALAEGSSPFNMMNPSRWFGGKSRDYEDYYDPGFGPYDRYGPYNRPGYGMPYGRPGYGVPYNAPPGYGYGAPPAPQGYAPARVPVPGAPQQTDDASASRIRELEERIRQLEAGSQMPPQPGMSSWQGTDNSAVPQVTPGTSTWQGGGSTNIPAPQAPLAQPSWQGTENYTQPTTQPPIMPPPWQRSDGNNPRATIEPPAAPSWQQGAGATPQMPSTPVPGLGGDATEQRHRFRPY